MSAHSEPPRTGVLLVNLGSPRSPAVGDVRRYLRQFLSDPRVVDLPRILWWPILYLIILPIRARKSAHAYASVWTSAGSPLLSISRKQAALLQANLGRGFHVEVAMRYGEPSIASALENLRAQRVSKTVLLSMFPQFSRATSGSVEAEVSRVAHRSSGTAPIAVVPPWFDHAAYIEALAARARDAVADRAVTHWVFSFHGLPERYVREGDPYRDHCEATARALAERLGLSPADWTLVYQSRFGPERWLQPYADVTVPALAAQHPRVAITMPGFTADCLETLEEIGMRLRADFLAAGGEELVVVPCVNDAEVLVEGLAQLVRKADEA